MIEHADLDRAIARIEGTEEVLEIKRKVAGDWVTVAVLIDAKFYAALRGEWQDEAY